MRILPINFYQQTNSIEKISNTRRASDSRVIKPMPVDTVSFGRVAENAEPMRRLFKYGMIDIHTAQYIIDPDYFESLLQNGVFERSARTIVSTLQPLKRCLHETELQVFEEIEKLTQKYPLYRLDQIIKLMTPKAQVELLSIQRPIFEELKDLSKYMPEEQKQAFDELMETTEQQLAHKKIPYKFSKKEFRYKLNQITKGIERRGISEEIKIVKKLEKMAAKLPYLPSGRNFARRKPKFDPKKSITQITIVHQMENIFSRSTLKNDKELKDLFEISKQQLFNIPTVIPFSRKVFIHNLEAITDTLEDKKLAHKLVKKAQELPSTHEEYSAFVMNSSRNSSTKIGHDLLFLQTGAIDHKVPKSKGGADDMQNYAFTTVGSNSKRGNMIMSKWMLKNPQTYIGSQKCVDRLIELKNKGILEKENFSPWYIIQFAESMEKLSPPEKKLRFDLSNF